MGGSIPHNAERPSTPKKLAESRRRWHVPAEIITPDRAMKKSVPMRIFTGLELNSSLAEELAAKSTRDPVPEHLRPPAAMLRAAEMIDIVAGNMHIGVHKLAPSDREYRNTDLFLGDYIIAPGDMDENDAKQIEAEYELTNLITGHEPPNHFEDHTEMTATASSGGM